MSQVIKFNDQPQIDRGNGATTAPLFLKENGARSFISGISTFKPGVSVPVHSHNTDEMVIVLEGKGECEIDGDKKQDRVIDTLELAREKFPGSAINLDSLCKKFRIDYSKRQKHNALVDCELSVSYTHLTLPTSDLV